MRTTPRELWRRLRRPAPVREPAPARVPRLILRPPGPDDFRDALALVQCAHAHDETGASAVLRYCDPLGTAFALSLIAHGLLADLIETDGVDHATAMARCRRAWAEEE